MNNIPAHRCSAVTGERDVG